MSCNDKLSHKHHTILVFFARAACSDDLIQNTDAKCILSLKSAEMSLDNGQLASSKVE